MSRRVLYTIGAFALTLTALAVTQYVLGAIFSFEGVTIAFLGGLFGGGKTTTTTELDPTWMTKDFPAIKKVAKRENADIFFGDEAGLRSDDHKGTTWAPICKTPIVKTTGARFGVNIVSAISPRGEMEFMITKGKFNSDTFIEFLEKLIRYKRKKIFLIVDGHPTHKSKKVNEFIIAHKDRLRLFILPPYSPELNPDELVWNTLKQNIGRKKVSGPDDLLMKVVDFLNSMVSNVQLVASSRSSFQKAF